MRLLSLQLGNMYIEHMWFNLNFACDSRVIFSKCVFAVRKFCFACKNVISRIVSKWQTPVDIECVATTFGLWPTTKYSMIILVVKFCLDLTIIFKSWNRLIFSSHHSQYSRLSDKRRPMLVNFKTFFQGLWSY